MSDQTFTKHNSRRKRPLLILLLAAAFSFIIFLALITVYSSDDYWYSTFMDHGAAAYFQMMKEHYLTFNGRMLVHFAAHVILHCGNALFALFLAGCCAVIPASTYAMEKRGGGTDGLLLCMLLFLAGVLMLPRSVVVNGFLWISASCNYVLPTAMVVAEIFLLRRFTDREERRFYPADLLLLSYCFLCGATTEQMGAAAVGVAGLFVLKTLILKRKRIWVSLLAAVCACCGVLTIFLSPATRQRLAKETVTDLTVGYGFIGHMRNQLHIQADTFSASLFIIAVFGTLFFFTAWLLLRRKGTPRWAAGVWLALSAVSLVLLRVLDGRPFLLAYLAVIGLTALQTVIWLACGYEDMTFVMLAGLGSVAVIMFTNSDGGRIFLPLCLCMLAVLATALMVLLEELPSAMARGGVVLALSLLSFAVIGVQLPGYWYNYRIDRINQESASRAKETGEVFFLMDYNKSYTHAKPYDDGYFFLTWVDSIGVDPSVCRINFCSEVLPKIYVAGERAQLLAPQLGSGDTWLLIPAQPSAFQPDNGDTWLLPLRYTIESLGGSLELLDEVGEHILIHLDGREYTYTVQGTEATVQWREGNATHSIKGECSQEYSMSFISEDVMTEAFGLQITHRDGDIYVDKP